jgi:hypothetical protein
MLCPQGGRPGVPSGFARNFLPQVGIFTILQNVLKEKNLNVVVKTFIGPK